MYLECQRVKCKNLATEIHFRMGLDVEPGTLALTLQRNVSGYELSATTVISNVFLTIFILL